MSDSFYQSLFSGFSRPTCLLRWIRRDGKMILQQQFQIVDSRMMASDAPLADVLEEIARNVEWRDVPVKEE